MRHWILLGLFALGVPDRVSIRVRPFVLMAGSAVTVTCKVPPDARNRQLNVGIAGYTQSTRQIDGDQSRITYEFTFAHIPCGVDTAACQIVGTDGQQTKTQPLTIGGCDQ